MQARRTRLAPLGTALALAIGALFLAIPLLAGPLSRLVPSSIQAAVGEHAIETLAAENEFCQAPEGLAALAALVDTMSPHAAGGHSFRVYVSDQDILNAFAAPGGHIVLYRSIIEEAETPAEVAGVLAHEMAHITEGHPARGMIEALGYGLFTLFTPHEENTGAELVKMAVTRHYSREDELAADRAGVELLNAAQLDSRGLMAFFDRLTQRGQEIPGAAQFLSSHPTGASRKRALADVVRPGRPALTDAQWFSLRNICSALGGPVYVAST